MLSSLAAGKYRKSWISDVSVFLVEEVFHQDNYVSSPNISGRMKEAIKTQGSMQAFPGPSTSPPSPLTLLHWYHRELYCNTNLTLDINSDRLAGGRF